MASFEHGKEPSLSIKCFEFLDQLNITVTSQDALPCSELQKF
jgi:hypothetical protein